MAKLPIFTMPFEPMTIEHLGLKLYSTLPPVISEFVSNAYDAESPKVEVILPSGKINRQSEVVIRDYGHGMNEQEIQAEFLPIGRARRGLDSKNAFSKNKKRRVTGRKGLGKLSAFGIAKEMDITSFNKGQSIQIRLNYDKMQEWGLKHGSAPYQPETIARGTGKTSEPDGVEIRLRNLHRSNAISTDQVRKGLAQRLSFIGKGFEVLVNGKPIQPGDRVSKTSCVSSWTVADIVKKLKIENDLSLDGWIGFLDKSSQVSRGIDIFASGKAVELGSFFRYPSTHVQYARAYIVGEIHANLLDADEDLVATARNSVVWESIKGQKLEKWGHQVLEWAFKEWLRLRTKEKEERVIAGTGFDKWIQGRPRRERSIAQRMVKLLVNNPDLDEASARPLLEIVKSSVESVAFHDLVIAIEEEGGTPATLLKLFQEWRIIEAREHLKLAQGRTGALDQLEIFIDKGALEVSEMQPLLAQNPWIIDPEWIEASIELKYTDLIRKHCKEPKSLADKDRRLDIWGVRDSTGVTIVELKRPQKTLSWKDLDQIEQYVLWARSNIMGTSMHAPRYINGLLVVGNLSSEERVQQKMQNLAGLDIRVATFRDLYVKARSFYKELDKRIQAVAPEYANQMKADRDSARRSVIRRKKGRKKRVEQGKG